MERNNKMARATELGLKFQKNISNEKLDKMIEEAELAKTASNEKLDKATEEAEIAAKAASYDTPKPKKEEVGKKKSKITRREALLLKPVIITPLDERMRTLPSELYCVGNGHIGTIKKVVRFNVKTLEPVLILDMLREKRALVQQTVTVKGVDHVVKRQGAAFAIEELPALTEEELEELTSK